MISLEVHQGPWTFFTHHWLLLALMPVVAGFIGWVTKVLAIEMVFRPIEFVGIGPIGWQGQLSRRAAKFGAMAADIILDNIIDPRELVDRIDPKRVIAETDMILQKVVVEVGQSIGGSAWDRAPASARAAVLKRAQDSGPVIVENLLDSAKANIDELFRLSYIVTAELIADKRLLVDLVRGPMAPIMKFMRRFGLIFGTLLGLAQMVAFTVTQNHLVIPLFGLVIGLVSDWVALQMLFRPTRPRRVFGVFPWYGLAFQYRKFFVDEYAVLAAERIFTPQLLMRALLEGPLSERLSAMIQEEVLAAIDKELGAFERIVPAAVGSQRYLDIRNQIVAICQAHVPAASTQLETYTAEALDIENTLRNTMSRLSNEDLEAILRPVFKDDEWLVVAVGGGLGFAIGELQLSILTAFGGL